MARENQGLHVALIVFVVLTIFLAVLTFVFFSQASDAKKEAIKNRQDADKANNGIRDKGAQMEELQKWLGFDPTISLEDMRKDVATDMLTYAPADVEESNKVYRQVLRRQFEVIQQTESDLARTQEKVTQHEKALEAVNALTDQKVAQFQSAAEEAKNELARERQKFEQDRTRMTQSQERLAAELKEKEEAFQAQVNKLKADVDKLAEDNKKIHELYVKAKSTVDDMRRETPDQFHGEIRWVDHRGGTVWINLGEADAIRPQTKFSVFGAGAGDLSEANKKASIEVTRVRSPHLAEARIVDDSMLDPVLVGDRIYTPVWSVGEKRRFALAGIIDLDGDGRSDLHRMHTLIRANGGIVDAEMDETGKRQGEISMDTRYLVLGNVPGVDSPLEVREDWKRIRDQARNLSIETITLDRFLELMGWVRQVEVANYGDGSASQFPVERTNKPSVSTGGISELFKPRTPPRGAVGTKY